MQALRSYKRFIGPAVVLAAACSGAVAWITQSRCARSGAPPGSELSEPIPAGSSGPERPDDPLGPDEPHHPTEGDAIAEDANEGDAAPNSACGPLLWLPVEDEKEWEREQLAEYPDAFPIYRYVKKAARPLDEAVSALLPNQGNRGKCGQGVTFGYDLQGGPATKHCAEGRCYWVVRATIVDDRSYRPAEKVHSALPWLYFFEVERVGAPVVIEIPTPPNESARFTKMSDAVRFVRERVRSGGLPQ